MQKLSVLIALLAGLAIAVPTINDPGLTTQDNSWSQVPPDAVPDDQVGPRGTSSVTQTSEPDYLLTTGSPGTQELRDNAAYLHPFFDWGDDVLVDDLNEMPSQGKIATDVEEDGTIWMAILDPDPGATNDTIWHYYSTNGGETWTYWNFIGGPSGDIRDFDLVVGSHGGTDYVYTFIVYDGTGGLYCRYLDATDGGTFGWTQIQGGDTLAEVSADRNIETPQHIFCGWVGQGGSVKLASSSDGCLTFGNQRNVASGRRNPVVCAGGAGYVYITYLDAVDSTFYRVGRYTNNLISPTTVFVNVDSSEDHSFYRVSIAADRTAPGGSQTALVLSNYKHTNGNIGPRYAWTENGGTSWNSSFWPPTNQSRETWDARWPYIRRSYYDQSAMLFRAVVTMHEPSAAWDTVVYAYSRPATPTDWEARAEPNDYRITGEFGAKLDWSDNVDGGGYILYREYNSTEVWVDGWNFTGVAEGEQPRGARDNDVRVPTLLDRDAGIRFNLGRATHVSARLHDGAGRVIENVFTGTLDAGDHNLPLRTQGLPAGIYFLNLALDGAKRTTKLVRLN